MSSVGKKTKKKKEPKKEVKKDLTPQLVTRDLADNTYSGIIREDLLGAQFLEGPSATYQWSSGAKYEGPFVASQIEGKGKFFWPDGSTYEGELLGGKRHGEGTYVAQDGKTRYEGQWSSGKRHGQGKLTYAADSSSYYEGGWQAGQKHGHGKQLWPTGNCYEGEWQLGKMSGEGTMIWRMGSSAEKYTGQWVDNCPHGEGTHTWMVADPSKEQETTDNWLLRPSPPPSAGHAVALSKHPAPPHGRPELQPHQDHRRHDARPAPEPHATQQLNNRYAGQWVWGRREGNGTFYYANGAYYHGEWKNHVKQGYGRHTFDNGKVYEGAFEADRMTDYSKPPPHSKAQAALEENPICSCTDISDLETVLRPSDHAGFPLTSGAGYADPTKILKGVYNMLLRNLGELREAYARSRTSQPLLGEDPYAMTSVQFWGLARDAGILSPACPIARFDRAIFSGPRHHREVAPADEEDLRPLTPRVSDNRQSQCETQRQDSSMRLSNLLTSSKEQAEESASQAGNSEETSSLASDLPSPSNEDEEERPNRKESSCEPGLEGTQGAAAVGKKFVRTSSGGGNLVHIHAPARPLLFRQFLESFVRLALVRFPNEQGLEPQVQRLFKEQVLPSFKAAVAAAKPDPGLTGMLSDARPPPGPVFGLFTQPEVQEVVKEVEPELWKVFVALSGDEPSQQAAGTIRGGGVYAGAGGLGAVPSNVGEEAADAETATAQNSPTPSPSSGDGKASGKAAKKMSEGADDPAPAPSAASMEEVGEAAMLQGHAQAVRSAEWGSASRKLHVLARLNTSLRIKDVLRFLDSLGILKSAPPSEAMQRLPLCEVLQGSTGDSINNLLCPLGTGLSAEEFAEEDNQSEDEEGSGGSAAPEEDILEDKGGKQLPGLAKLTFMPQGSLLSGVSGGISAVAAVKDDKKKKEKEKEEKKKGKQEEKEVLRTPADDLACINLMVDAMDVLRILAQVMSPGSLEALRWELGTDSEEAGIIDERVSLLEFLETEIVFAEFLRFLFLLAELTTRRDSKFCRSISLSTRLDCFMKSMVLAHLQAGSRYRPPEPPDVAAPPRLGDKGEKGAAAASPKVTAAEGEAQDAESGKGAGEEGVAEAEEEATPPKPKTPPPPEPEHWHGFDGKDARAENLRVPRRWPAGYEQEVAGWN